MARAAVPRLPEVQELVPLFDKNVHDLFIEEIINDLRGYVVESRKSPISHLIFIGITAVLLALTGILYVTGQSPAAYGAVGLLAALETIVVVWEHVEKRG